MTTTKAGRSVGGFAANHSASPPVVRSDLNLRRTARLVGVLFLAGYGAYGVGSLIAQGIVRSDDRSGSLALFVIGAALMLLNSAFVIGIGVLLFPILRPHNKDIAAGYVGTRIFEGVVLAIGVVSLIALTGSRATDANAVFYSVAEGGLGIGSLFLCSALPHRTRSAFPSCLEVSSATRASPGATCWNCSASRAPGSSAPSPADCLS
jgi:hypothetical protein